MQENIIRNGKLFINCEQCCYRCGLAKSSAEIKEGWQCSGWGVVYPTHLWKIRKKKGKEQSIIEL